VPVPVPVPLLPPDVVVPGVVLTVAAGCGVVAARSWLAEVFALERVPWTAWFVAAPRWSVCVVLVGAMIAAAPDVPVPDDPEPEVDGAGAELVMTGGVPVVTPLPPVVPLDVPPNECVTMAAGKACAITGAANSTATRRASEAAGVGLRIDVSLTNRTAQEQFDAGPVPWLLVPSALRASRGGA
jgi:hypothetical protein